jgi:hypothetical protein
MGVKNPSGMFGALVGNTASSPMDMATISKPANPVFRKGLDGFILILLKSDG